MAEQIKSKVGEKEITCRCYKTDLWNDEENKLKMFLENYFGTSIIPDLFAAIKRILSSKDVYFELDQNTYILKNDNICKTKDFLSKIRKVLNEQAVVISENEVEEIIDFLKELCDYNNYDNQVIYFSENFCVITTDRMLTNLNIHKTFGKLKVEAIKSDFNAFFQKNNVAFFLKFNNNYSPILLVDDNFSICRDKKFFTDAVESIFLNHGLCIELLGFRVNFLNTASLPSWIPYGFNHYTGDLKTGYVVIDKLGNEYVYLKELNIYMSRYPITLINDLPMSVPNFQRKSFCTLKKVKIDDGWNSVFGYSYGIKSNWRQAILSYSMMINRHVDWTYSIKRLHKFLEDKPPLKSNIIYNIYLSNIKDSRYIYTDMFNCFKKISDLDSKKVEKLACECLELEYGTKDATKILSELGFAREKNNIEENITKVNSIKDNDFPFELRLFINEKHYN